MSNVKNVKKTGPQVRTVTKFDGMTRVTDSLGRTFYCKPLKLSEQLRLISALGKKNADNQYFMNVAILVASVRYIVESEGSEPVLMPAIRNEDEMYAAVDRVESEGVLAITEELGKATQELMTEDEFKDQVKNS